MSHEAFTLLVFCSEDGVTIPWRNQVRGLCHSLPPYRGALCRFVAVFWMIGITRYWSHYWLVLQEDIPSSSLTFLLFHGSVSSTYPTSAGKTLGLKYVGVKPMNPLGLSFNATCCLHAAFAGVSPREWFLWEYIKLFHFKTSRDVCLCSSLKSEIFEGGNHILFIFASLPVI